MSVSRILLADNDVEYGRSLARAVSNLHNDFEFTITVFEANVRERFDKEVDFLKFDLILIGGYPDKIAESVSRKVSKNKIVLLTEVNVESLVKQFDNKTDRYWYLFKYQDSSLIISDLNFLIGALTGKKSLLKKSSATELLGFFSISGGAGKTVVALGVSRELERYRDKKVLYLCFEDLPATELLFMNHSQSRNVGDYLYYLFEKQDEQLCGRIESFTVSDDFGVETFLPSGGRNDLNNLAQDELIKFLKVLSDSCRYDYIVLDLKSDLEDKTLFLLSLCGSVILIQNDDPVSRFKNEKLAAYLGKPESNNTACRFIFAVNRTKRTENDEKKICIENDDSSFQFGCGHLNVSISHSFGIGMKKIADEILSADQ